MASRFVVALAVFAVCQSSPVIKSGRSYTEGKGYASGNGRSQASASIINRDAQAYSSNNDDGHIARDAFGNGLPGQAYAKVNVYDTPDTVIGRVQPAYYPIPAPATVIAYQQYDAPETPSQIVYETPSLAQSSAVTNGGYGTADSNAAAGNGLASSNARTQGGPGSASSVAQTNGFATPVEVNPTIIAAKHQGLQTVYTPAYAPAGYASSDAKVNGLYGSAASIAKTGAVPARKSISWRFGTAYDKPASYAKAAADNLGYGAANANADVIPGSGLRSAANTEGAGSAQSDAKTGIAGYNSVNSAVNSYGGHSTANADINNVGYSVLRSGENYGYNGYNGDIKSTAEANGFGSASSNADIDGAGQSHLKSVANSQSQGSAHSAANTGGYTAGLRSVGWGSRTGTDAQATGQSSAESTAQNLRTEYRVNSVANSAGLGAARAHSYSG